MADHSKEFFGFLIRKDFDWDSIFEEMSDRLMEDEFNSPIAEKALDIACDLYPDGSDTEDELMEKRHEFVSDFMEHCRCEYIKQCAENLGMVTIEKAQENADAQTKFAVKVYKDRLDLQADNFRNMSSYQFSAWKLDQDMNEVNEDENYFDPCELDIHYDSTSRIPQDSEDECWEQMKVMQKNIQDDNERIRQAQLSHSQDIPGSFLKDN